jgi:DHA1 family bicyclomycin/chloramphenicol resistance-like MFS transporter
MAPKNNPKDIKVTLLLTLMVALGPLSTDLYLPSLPSLTETFGTTISRVQATMSVFIGGFACATVIYGPLSDRFGRRPVLIGGMAIFVVGSLGCMAASSIEALISWRFVQAVGGCAGPVLVRAVVRDVYEKEEAVIFLAYIASAMALAPAVAPMIGGWLHVLFGWRSHFVALTILGVLFILAIHMMIKETNSQRDHSATQARQLAQNFSHILMTPQFIAFSLMLMFSYGALFSFISVGAFVVIGVLGIAPDKFGYLFFFVAIGYACGGLLAGKLVRRIGVIRIIGVGISLGLTLGVLGFGFAISGAETTPAVIIPIVGVFFSCGFVLPTATAVALEPFPQIAGTASSAVGFLQMSGGAIIGFVAGYLHNGTTVPLFTVILLSWICAAVVYIRTRARGTIRPSGSAKTA